MTISQIKSNARASLKGKFWLTLGVVIVYSLIVSASGVTGIGPIILAGPLTAGFFAYFIGNLRGENAKFDKLFSGFNDFGPNCAAGVLVFLYTMLWTLLFFIPGIVKSYSYSMTFYILKDHPELSANDAITASRKLMNGHKWKMFVLQLSFIGWAILSMLTAGILLVYVIPYIYASQAQFYESIKDEYATKCV